MSQCPDCRNEFVQPFVCTTCGAQKLYDVTLQSAQDEITRLRALLAECRPYIFDAVGGALGWKDSAFGKITNLLDRIDATLKERGQ